ncbi:MAG: dihydrofolate reductase [Paraglaciecola psychrophila]|jgi:dihydrofolate reductase
MGNHVYIACSLDGYIATVDGDIDWLFDQPNSTESDYGYADFISNIDALVMGRNSFDKVRDFDSWPYKEKVFVLSSHLKEVPEHLLGHIEILSGSPDDIVATINAAGYQNLYIDGGVTIARFLQRDLIDEMIITRLPVLLGDGVPLFGGLAQPLNFIHVGTKVHDDALVTSHYRRRERS